MSLVKVEGSDNWDLMMVDNNLSSHARYSTLQIEELFDALKARLHPSEVVVQMPAPTPSVVVKPKTTKSTLGPDEYAPGKCHGRDSIGRRCKNILFSATQCKKHDLETRLANGEEVPEPVKTKKLTCTYAGCRCKLVDEFFCKKHATLKSTLMVSQSDLDDDLKPVAIIPKLKVPIRKPVIDKKEQLLTCNLNVVEAFQHPSYKKKLGPYVEFCKMCRTLDKYEDSTASSYKRYKLDESLGKLQRTAEDTRDVHYACFQCAKSYHICNLCDVDQVLLTKIDDSYLCHDCAIHPTIHTKLEDLDETDIDDAGGVVDPEATQLMFDEELEKELTEALIN